MRAPSANHARPVGYTSTTHSNTGWAEGGMDRPDCVFDRLSIGHVAMFVVHIEFRRQRRTRFVVDIEDRDLCTIRLEPSGGGFAESAGPAGNDDCLLRSAASAQSGLRHSPDPAEANGR